MCWNKGIDYVEKQQSCWISVTLKSCSGPKLLDRTTYVTVDGLIIRADGRGALAELWRMSQQATFWSRLSCTELSREPTPVWFRITLTREWRVIGCEIYTTEVVPVCFLLKLLQETMKSYCFSHVDSYSIFGFELQAFVVCKLHWKVIMNF